MMRSLLPGRALRLFVALTIALGLSGRIAAAQDVPVVEGGAGGDLEARMAKLEQSLQGRGLLDLANQVESLQQEVNQLRGELEQQQHLIDQLQSKMQNAPAATAAAPVTTDPRWPAPAIPSTSAATNTAPGAAAPPETVANTGAQAVPPPTTEPPPTPTTPPVAVAAPTTAPTAPTAAAPTPPPGANVGDDPDQSYAAAFNALKAGNYEDAIAQFNNFLVSHPDSEKADSAQYWLGEAYYVNKQFEPAINEYQKLLAAYPKSQKVSQAMLKIGFCQQELGQSDKAKATLQEVLQRYPGTTSARMAEDRLQRMRLEQPNAKL